LNFSARNGLKSIPVNSGGDIFIMTMIFVKLSFKFSFPLLFTEGKGKEKVSHYNFLVVEHFNSIFSELARISLGFPMLAGSSSEVREPRRGW
jgi:hypothetical protein